MYQVYNTIINERLIILNERRYMAEKDLSSKKLEDYNDIFADIYNTLLFEREYIEPEWLEDSINFHTRQELFG